MSFLAAFFGHRRKRRRSAELGAGSVFSIWKSPVFLLMLILFMASHTKANSFKELLGNEINNALTERIKALTSASSIYIPGKIEVGQEPKDRSFAKILAGQYREVSVEALYRFLDSMRETTVSLQLIPLWAHEADCHCLDHINHDLLTELMHYTRDNPKYGESLLVKPGFSWSPPLHASYATTLNRVRLYSHLYLGIALVILILSWSVLLMFLKHRHLKKIMAEGGDAGKTVDDAEHEGGAKTPEGKFDVTRIDLL